MADIYEWGKAARMTCARVYLGLERDEMAKALGIALRSYQRYENGQTAIPQAMWPRVTTLTQVFDKSVETLLIEADGKDHHRVVVWRGWHEGEVIPSSMWLRIVAEAIQENPAIEPYFPEDENPPADNPAAWRG